MVARLQAQQHLREGHAVREVRVHLARAMLPVVRGARGRAIVALCGQGHAVVVGSLLDVGEQAEGAKKSATQP